VVPAQRSYVAKRPIPLRHPPHPAVVQGTPKPLASQGGF